MSGWRERREPEAMAALRIAIVAGETSGDALGAALIEALLALVPDIEFTGVAGPSYAKCNPLLKSKTFALPIWHGK